MNAIASNRGVQDSAHKGEFVISSIKRAGEHLEVKFSAEVPDKRQYDIINAILAYMEKDE